ncbi:Holin-like protein CidA [Tepidimonas thermarum]|uniref:Holin-like protein CidA n=1 Tax=Tepidimonas thermarum TaxID=335431 RepID=A0A554X4B5_9BURK|nr:CidA/LrgA family protein [Tepidimonas thermarum]TSE30655.1 Holin-like protein CidA [Tepidimonas thermarum]
MLGALTTLLTLQLVGEVLVRMVGLPIPGPVLGMALLLAVLTVRPAWRAALQPTADGLLRHLSLLFVPAGVGVVQHLQRLGDEALAIAVALTVSTWVGLLVTAATVRALIPHDTTAVDNGEPR